MKFKKILSAAIAGVMISAAGPEVFSAEKKKCRFKN